MDKEQESLLTAALGRVSFRCPESRRFGGSLGKQVFDSVISLLDRIEHLKEEANMANVKLSHNKLYINGEYVGDFEGDFEFSITPEDEVEVMCADEEVICCECEFSEDEMIGYIMRRLYWSQEDVKSLTYAQVKAILDAEEDYFEEECMI